MKYYRRGGWIQGPKERAALAGHVGVLRYPRDRGSESPTSAASERLRLSHHRAQGAAEHLPDAEATYARGA